MGADGAVAAGLVADVDRRAEAHVDVLEIGTGVLADVFDRLREHDVHHQARRRDQALESAPPLYLFIYNLARFRDLKKEDDYGF